MDWITKAGGEGIILRKPDGEYQYKWCDDVLKVKRFMDAEATVIGIEPGKNRLIGWMGALICKNKEGA